MVRVRVPATSANMGPGFDSLGIAIDVYNTFSFEEIDKGLEFKGIPEEFCNEDNIIYEAMIRCFELGKYSVKGLRILVDEQNIPISRGLGSSSSCIVAGLVGANAIMGNKFSKHELLELAVDMEGHPDNVAPAMLGGMVVAVMDEGHTYYDKVSLRDDLRLVPIIPNFKLETKKARGVLPDSLSYKDGVYNVSRAALMVAALSSGKYELLKYACKDAFHENYRSSLIEGFYEIKEEGMKRGALASFLSGAGPTIMAIIKRDNSGFEENIRKFLDAMGLAWEVKISNVDNLGAVIIEGDIS